jgi:hypothetical protein
MGSTWLKSKLSTTYDCAAWGTHVDFSVNALGTLDLYFVYWPFDWFDLGLNDRGRAGRKKARRL